MSTPEYTVLVPSWSCRPCGWSCSCQAARVMMRVIASDPLSRRGPLRVESECILPLIRHSEVVRVLGHWWRAPVVSGAWMAWWCSPHTEEALTQLGLDLQLPGQRSGKARLGGRGVLPHLVTTRGCRVDVVRSVGVGKTCLWVIQVWRTAQTSSTTSPPSVRTVPPGVISSWRLAA